ncbi:LamB/YcsF family protein [compost metagenome]
MLQAVASYDRSLPLMLMATKDNSAAQQLGDEYGVTLWFEAFADRAYDSAGRLVSRQTPGAVHHDPEHIIEQALTIARGDPLTAIDGSALHLQANTLCVHGDNASSVAAVQRIRQALNQQSTS